MTEPPVIDLVYIMSKPNILSFEIIIIYSLEKRSIKN